MYRGRSLCSFVYHQTTRRYSNSAASSFNNHSMEATTKGYNLSIQINTITLFYDDVGEGGTPVIFLHGFPFDRTMWKQQVDFLKSAHRVIAIDLRGFGKSTDEQSPLSIDLFTDDLIMFLHRMHIDKAIICGLSMGGYIALNAVKRFPDRFEALILCDTQCIADTPEAKDKRYASIDEINSKGVDAFNEKFIQGVFYEKSLETKKEVVQTLRDVVFSNSTHIMTAGLKALAERSETCSALHKITIPTLIICGKEDALAPLAQSEAMHVSIDGSVLRVIEEAGHVSNLEQPEAFNQHLAYFMNALNTIEVLTGNGKKQ